MSEVEQRPMLVTAGYRQHRRQWVKQYFKCNADTCSWQWFATKENLFIIFLIWDPLIKTAATYLAPQRWRKKLLQVLKVNNNQSLTWILPKDAEQPTVVDV